MADDVFEVAGVDELYELEPSQFVAARDALAKKIRSDGDRSTAAAVKKLRRPTVVAWALNQVARRDPERIGRLLDAGIAVRDRQVELLRGGDRAALREVSRARRELVSSLAAAAADIAGAAHLDEATSTLDAASLDEDAAESLRSGRLTKELQPPSGFGLLGMSEPLSEPAARAHDDETARREAERQRRELEAAKDALAAAEHEVQLAEQRVLDARQNLEATEAEAASARARADAARDALGVLHSEG